MSLSVPSVPFCWSSNSFRSQSIDLENPYALPSAKSPGAQPNGKRRGGFWEGNWSGSTMLLPFILMLLARVPLGVSDAFQMGDQWDANYNLCMLLALFLGSLAFLVHTFARPLIKGYGWGWVAPKLIFLATVWGIFFAIAALLATKGDILIPGR